MGSCDDALASGEESHGPQARDAYIDADSILRLRLASFPGLVVVQSLFEPDRLLEVEAVEAIAGGSGKESRSCSNADVGRREIVESPMPLG